MACNCNEGNVYHIGMGCCTPVVANADAYYTKSEIDKKIDDIIISGGGITQEIAQEMIDASIAEIDIPTVPTRVSAFENDVPYLTQHQSLEGYVTENNLTAYTYDKETIEDKIAQGSIFDPTQYYNKTATNELLAAKADTATTYSKTETDSLLSNKANTSDLNDYYNKSQADTLFATKSEIPTDFYTKAQVDAKIPSLNGYATENWVQNQGYQTSTDVSNAISGKADTTALTQVNNALTAHTADTTMHVTTAQTAAWDAKSNFSGSYNDLTDKPSIPSVWQGTKAQYDAITTKDNNTIYLIYEE